MNKKQEQALFGNVLRDFDFSNHIELDLGIIVGGTAYGGPSIVESTENLLYLASSQREAIGALIEIHLWQGTLTADQCSDTIYLDTESIILSAVQQDTWEEVREAWVLENES